MKQYSQEEILRMFYLCGAVIFIIVGLSNIYTNFVFWESMILSAKVSAVASNIFNFVLAIFFFLLLRGMKQQIDPIGEEIADEIIKEVEQHA